jgi:hypothetical protein
MNGLDATRAGQTVNQLVRLAADNDLHRPTGAAMAVGRGSMAGESAASDGLVDAFQGLPMDLSNLDGFGGDGLDALSVTGDSYGILKDEAELIELMITNTTIGFRNGRPMTEAEIEAVLDQAERDAKEMSARHARGIPPRPLSESDAHNFIPMITSWTLPQRLQFWCTLPQRMREMSIYRRYVLFPYASSLDLFQSPVSQDCIHTSTHSTDQKGMPVATAALAVAAAAGASAGSVPARAPTSHASTNAATTTLTGAAMDTVAVSGAAVATVPMAISEAAAAGPGPMMESSAESSAGAISAINDNRLSDTGQSPDADEDSSSDCSSDDDKTESTTPLEEEFTIQFDVRGAGAPQATTASKKPSKQSKPRGTRVEKGPRRKRLQWTQEEHEKLVKVRTENPKATWRETAMIVGTKDRHQCFERWKNNCDGTNVGNKLPWTLELDTQLVALHQLHRTSPTAACQARWRLIQAQLKPQRSQRSIRNHFYSTMRRAASSYHMNGHDPMAHPLRKQNAHLDNEVLYLYCMSLYSANPLQKVPGLLAVCSYIYTYACL